MGVGLGTESPAGPLAGLAALSSAGSLLQDDDNVRRMLSEAGLDKWPEQAAIRRARRCEALAREALQTPELASALALAAGLRSASKLSVTSREHGEGMRRVLPNVRDTILPLVFVIGGSTQGTELSAVECFNLTNGTWEVSQSLPTQRRWCGATARNGRLYVFGGHNGARAVRAAECFDIFTGIWDILPDMPSAREACVAFHLHGLIYVLGGSAFEETLESVEQFDPASLEWSILPPMPIARDACAVAVMSSSAFLCGGRGAVPFHDSVDRFWPPVKLSNQAGRWEAQPPMLTARLGCTAVVVRSILYVCGGQGNGQVLSSVESYDTSRGYWEECLPMPTPRIGSASVALGDAIIVFGGHNGQSAVGIVERFIMDDFSWDTLPSMPTARYACAVVPVRA